MFGTIAIVILKFIQTKTWREAKGGLFMKMSIMNLATTLLQKFNRPELAGNEILSVYSECHDYPRTWFADGSTGNTLACRARSCVPRKHRLLVNT